MMDAGLAIRPTTAVAALVRPEPTPVRTAVQTTLAASRSVTAAAGSDRLTGHDSARNALLQQQMTRELVIDSQTREVIFRLVDVRTGQVERQMPDAALLRLRAYNRNMVNGESPLESDANTDTEV
jgi:hypothetical protein